MTTENITQQEQFKQFLNGAQAKVTEHYKDSVCHPTLSFEEGPRYIRVITTDCSSRSVYCFIDKATGAILKANSWKAPHKTPRGNINQPDFGLSAVTPYGANYIR